MIHMLVNFSTSIDQYLIFRQKKIITLAGDAVPYKEHPVILNTKIQIPKPEHHPRIHMR